MEALSSIPVSALVQAQTEDYCRVFVNAEPYRHVAIDDFFEAEFAADLLRDFPRFDPSLAKNEIYRGAWGKAVNTNIRQIGPTYQRLYDIIGSQEFLDLIGRISGIDRLLTDPKMYGGGTHENLHGQDLDPHVDFNYDEDQKLHRRLNLIVYLNHDWQEEWGGGLEIHSNPRDHKENRIKTFSPIFNRAVLFETNEYSWHGFPKIQLPESERHRSRKSISIYLYTRERPAQEIAPMHGTFYVHRPLATHFEPGYALDESDVKHLQFEMDRRDKWIELYQRMELTKNGEIAERDRYIADILSRVRAPLTGYLVQEGTSTGLFPDGWAGPECSLTIHPLEPVRKLTVKGWRPDYAPASARLSVSVDGIEQSSGSFQTGLFELTVDFEPSRSEPANIRITCDGSFQPPGDHRHLAFVFMELRAQH